MILISLALLKYLLAPVASGWGITVQEKVAPNRIEGSDHDHPPQPSDFHVMGCLLAYMVSYVTITCIKGNTNMIKSC